MTLKSTRSQNYKNTTTEKNKDISQRQVCQSKEQNGGTGI